MAKSTTGVAEHDPEDDVFGDRAILEGTDDELEIGHHRWECTEDLLPCPGSRCQARLVQCLSIYQFLVHFTVVGDVEGVADTIRSVCLECLQSKQGREGAPLAGCS